MRLWLWPFLVGCFGMGWEALAYTPPSNFILETFAKKHALHSQVLKLTTVISNSPQPSSSAIAFKEVAYFDSSQTLLRSVILNKDDVVLGCIELPGASLSLVSRLLFTSDIEQLASALKEKNVPLRSRDDLDAGHIESSSLVRLDQQIEKPVWKIGSLTQPAPVKENISPGISLQKESWEPALFFEKDSFLPLRAIYEDFRDHQIYEFNFSDYRFFKEFPYPKMITVSKKGELLLSAQMTEAALLPHKAFPALKAIDSSSLSSAAKDLLKLYYASVR